MLVPVDERLAASNSRDCSPTTTEADVVLVVEEVCGVGRIEVHGLEVVELEEGGACPFPKTSNITLSAELISVASDGGRMPVLEADVAALKIGEQIVGIQVGAIGTILERTP